MVNIYCLCLYVALWTCPATRLGCSMPGTLIGAMWRVYPWESKTFACFLHLLSPVILLGCCIDISFPFKFICVDSLSSPLAVNRVRLSLYTQLSDPPDQKITTLTFSSHSSMSLSVSSVTKQSFGPVLVCSAGLPSAWQWDNYSAALPLRFTLSCLLEAVWIHLHTLPVPA